ncbi:unnamed protein product, partial [Laminaria digitata]
PPTTTLPNHNRVVTAPSRRSLVRGRRYTSATANASTNASTSARALDIGADAVDVFNADKTRREVARLRSAPSSFLLACCCLLPAAVQGFVPPCGGGVGVGSSGASASSLLRQHHHQYQHHRQYQQRQQQQQQQGLSAATLFRTAGRVSLLPVGRSNSVVGSLSGSVSGSLTDSHTGSGSCKGSASGSCSDSILGGDGRISVQGGSRRAPPSLSALDGLRRAVAGPPALAATSTTAAGAAASPSASTASTSASTGNAHSADVTTTTATPSRRGSGYGKREEGSLKEGSLPALAFGVARRRF